MRQASRNQRSLMQQGRTARYVEIISARTQPHLGESFFLAMNSGTLDDAQWTAVTAHIDAYLWHFEDCYLQFEAGTIDLASWKSDLATITFFVALPVFRAQWRTVRALSSGRYRDFMDSLMREVPMAKLGGDWRARWNAHLAEELAKAT